MLALFGDSTSPNTDTTARLEDPDGSLRFHQQNPTLTVVKHESTEISYLRSRIIRKMKILHQRSGTPDSVFL